jgi:hypothetical protein
VTAPGVGLVLAAVLLLTGCKTYTSECAGHGGLNHLGRVGTSTVAECNDGTWVS